MGEQSDTIALVVNGEPYRIPRGTTAAELVARLAPRTPAFALERNGRLVRRQDLEQTALADGDRIEIVTFVGGG
ncbi:MAG: thiamine biosynthesis protein ThiS [Planctomycetota bacterium]|nr:MAG: thiamine biosynthesis protein ThiS [Planctomycetota bacterium]